MAEEQLRFLESLTPEQALRYKCFSTARIHPKIVEHALKDLLHPEMDPDRKERLCTAIGVATKAFAIELFETAKEVSHAGGLEQNVAPGHLFEAYRRLAAQGRVVGLRKIDSGEPVQLDVDNVMHEFLDQQSAASAMRRMPHLTTSTTEASRGGLETNPHTLDEALRITHT